MIIARGTGADDDHAAALYDQHRHGKRRFTRMLENEIDVCAFARYLPNRRTEFPRFLHPRVELGRIDLRQLSPTVEILAIENALGAELAHEIRFFVVGNDADGIGS